MPAVNRRGLLLGGGALLAGAIAPRPAFAQAREYAVFTELSPNTKLMKPGWNRRIFTDTDSRKGNGIQCDFTTGVLTLAPGAYHFSGMSMVTYHADSEPPETTTIKAPASAGYCRLRHFEPTVREDSNDLRAIDNSDRSVICVGSVSSANLVPSLFEGFLETGRPAQIVLEHQSGSNPQQIYLRVFVENSKWHAMARIAVRSL
jgi:hypothetical protein